MRLGKSEAHIRGSMIVVAIEAAHAVRVAVVTAVIAVMIVIHAGQFLRHVCRQIARVPREGEKLIRVRDTGRMIGIGYRPDKIVIVRNERKRSIWHTRNHMAAW
jgi:hypothetical protein